MNDKDFNSGRLNPYFITTAAISLLFLLLFSLEGKIGRFFFPLLALVNLTAFGASLLADNTLFDRISKDMIKINREKIALGLLSAVLLYAIFFCGDLALKLILTEAEQNLARIYLLKQALPAWLIAVLIALIIGPGEELFWRCFLQHNLCRRFGRMTGLISASLIYSVVHIGSWNSTLVLAALVCGLFWGLLYLWKESILLNIISHSVWDIAVFLLFPF